MILLHDLLSDVSRCVDACYDDLLLYYRHVTVCRKFFQRVKIITLRFE